MKLWDGEFTLQEHIHVKMKYGAPSRLNTRKLPVVFSGYAQPPTMCSALLFLFFFLHFISLPSRQGGGWGVKNKNTFWDLSDAEKFHFVQLQFDWLRSESHLTMEELHRSCARSHWVSSEALAAWLLCSLEQREASFFSQVSQCISTSSKRFLISWCFF